MTLSDALTVLAVVLAPFFAVFAQRQVELWREAQERKLWVFKALMATRARTLSPDHVQALNMIELEFTRKAEEPVLAAWREYRDHLYSFPRDGGDLEARAAVWNQRTQDLLANLLEGMGRALGYKLDPVQVRKGAYSPEAHAAAEMEMQLVRRAALRWLTGGTNVQVSVVPEDEEAAERGKALAEGLASIIRGEKRVGVDLAAGQVSGLGEAVRTDEDGNRPAGGQEGTARVPVSAEG
jgi:hypothetical protein